LRIETCAAISDWIAWLAHEKLRIRYSVTDENLAFAFPELNADQRHRLGRKMWRHIVLMLCELVHAPRKIHRTNWQDYVSTKDIDREVKYLLTDRPVIVVSGHFGNFEVGGLVSALLGYPTFTVARPLDNPFLDRFMQRFREATGQYILPKRGSSPQVDQILNSGGTLVILGDQSAGAKGCWIEFFGRLASCHKAVALFTLTQNAPMVFCYSKRVDDKPMHFEIGVVGVYDPEVDGARDVDELSQWYSSLLEDVIRTAPDQYWWLHRRWKKPPARVVRRHQKRLAKRLESFEASKSA
jgi:KDO2-lipid IV(A) lauroyltransferase